MITALENAKRSNRDCFCLVLPEADENEERIGQLKSILDRKDAEKAELVARIGSKKRNEKVHAKLRQLFY